MNAVKTQDYGKSVVGPARCFAGGLHATRNNDQLRGLLHNSTEAPQSITKQTTRHAVKRCFASSRPDLAPNVFHLFWYLKRSLSWKRFSDNEEVKAAVNS
ncbi:hypothetical protein TNCV_870291 [Trichonephila clavipes]|nr:hypothetical protein TNCV_870291 [Trichonephila clavipes]